MTIAELIESVDLIKPNQIDMKTKTDWMITIEGQLWEEIILTHEDVPAEKFDTDKATGGSELMARPPYSDLYRFYLEAQIDMANGEVNRYNNSMAMFNAAWTAYRNYYNRRHMPVSRVKAFSFTHKRGCENGPLT